MSKGKSIAVIVLFASAATCFADDVLYRYEGDVHPLDASAGWLLGTACDEYCAERIEEGSLVFEWEHGELVNYTYRIASDSGDPPPPPTLWVEWRFWSNQPFRGTSYTCDADFAVDYWEINQTVFMFADTAISFDGGDVISGLDAEEFNTYRFESPDGVYYTFSADGQIFIDWLDSRTPRGAYIQMRGDGACDPDPLTNQVNKWDFVRFGTISYGETIIASDPPGGFVDARDHAELDRFTVTYDSANYVYIDEITVEVTGGIAPHVIQTRRRDNGEPDTVEIVLDRPIPMGETTRFTFDDGVAVNIVEYTFAPGDANGDGKADLFDLGVMQTCFGPGPLTGACLALDLDRDDDIDLSDFAAFIDFFDNT